MPHAAVLDLPADIVRELHRPRAAHGRRAAVFVLLYLIGAVILSLVAMSADRSWLIYLACAPLYLLAAASLHGISLFTHEAVHGTLSRKRVRNALLGAVCAWPVLQNFSAYRVLHLRHHNHLGEEGDPDHYNNYTRWTWLVFAMHWGRLLIGYPRTSSRSRSLGSATARRATASGSSPRCCSSSRSSPARCSHRFPRWCSFTRG
jgi:fatty acid desaturase